MIEVSQIRTDGCCEMRRSMGPRYSVPPRHQRSRLIEQALDRLRVLRLGRPGEVRRQVANGPSRLARLEQGGAEVALLEQVVGAELSQPADDASSPREV